jgi:hypothetical protein
MAATLVLLDPSAPPQTGRAGQTWTLDGLQGKVVGFIDNAKPNFNHLVDEIAELLTTRHGVVRVVKERKRAASIPAEVAALDALSAQCDLVITGSGD